MAGNGVRVVDVQPRISLRQAAEKALDLLDGRWSVALLVQLGPGAQSYTQLKREVNAVERRFGRRRHDRDMTAKGLMLNLVRLVDNGLVTRHERPADPSAGVPRSVTYRLTPAGRRLLSLLRLLGEWAATHYQQELASDPAGEGPH